MQFNWWQFLAGLGLFIFALGLVENSLKQLVGRPFKKIILNYSSRKLPMLLTSIGITALMQSSAIVLLVLSFVGAGMMKLRGALAAVLGSNLGTTFNSWLLAFLGFKFDLENITFPLVVIGLFGLIFLRKNERGLAIAHFFIGFGLVFISLDWLKTSMLFNDLWLSSQVIGFHFLWFIPLGFIITAIIQSSSATIVLGLTALYHQSLPFEHVAALVIGSELGTTVKFLIGSYGSLPDKKRVAWGNFLINFITLVIATAAIYPLITFVREILQMRDDLMALVCFQSIINILSILLFYPLLDRMAGWLESWFSHEKLITKYISESHSPFHDADLVLAEKELLYLLDRSLVFNRQILDFDSVKQTGWGQKLMEWLRGGQLFTENYQFLKGLLGEILEWLAGLHGDNEHDQERIKASKMIHIGRHIMRAVKNIKDIRHNLVDFLDSPNDVLYELIQQLKSNQLNFYHSLQSTVQNNLWHDFQLGASAMRETNRQNYDQSVMKAVELLNQKKISEMNCTSLMNIYREIYSSNKAYLDVMADLVSLGSE